SSLLRAGLTPRLKAAGHRVFIIRSFTDPLNQMTAALSHLLNDESSASLDETLLSGAWPIASLGESDVAALVELIRRAEQRWPNQAVVFFLDQFEEFFTLLGEETRARFLDALRQLFAHEALPFRLLFALREDLLA